jgi:predicted  nucleic acid-binding Zn-ribbon protein
MPTLYETDFYAWANEQAKLLREGNVAAADIAHIAEEIESMGRGEKRELVNRLEVLLMHLLKWAYQPDRRSRSWEVTIANQRDQLASHLTDNPSLKAHCDEAIDQAYRRARRDAELETGIAESTFPATCPWPFDRIMDETYWPN